MMTCMTNCRVVIVHDYVTQRGGAERVTLDLLRAFPGARLVTACYNPESTFPEFADYDVETLWINGVGALRRDPRRAFVFLARAFAEHRIDDADVVICSSSGWAHRVQTSAPKIVYCHNPARWLYQPDDYFAGMPAWLRKSFVNCTKGLRGTDAAAAHGAAQYLVNSAAVAGRVLSSYGIDSRIVAPARGLTPDGPVQAVPGVEPGFLLTVGRARGYKHTDAVVDAVASMPGERLVVVGGSPTRQWPAGVTALERLSDAQMRWLYANAAGLVAVAYEDFGLTPVEAQAFGLPTIALRAGGYLDSCVEDLTAVFVELPTADRIAAGIRDLRSRTWDTAAIKECGERYSVQAFAARVHTIVDEVRGSVPAVDPAGQPVRSGRLGTPAGTTRRFQTQPA